MNKLDLELRAIEALVKLFAQAREVDRLFNEAELPRPEALKRLMGDEPRTKPKPDPMEVIAEFQRGAPDAFADLDEVKEMIDGQ